MLFERLQPDASPNRPNHVQKDVVAHRGDLAQIRALELQYIGDFHLLTKNKSQKPLDKPFNQCYIPF